MKRKLQIGIMGSAADLDYSKELKKVAEKIGFLIAKSGNNLVFGAEKDYDSLSTIAAKAAKKEGGLTIGVTYNKSKEIFNPESADIIIATGLGRGGGREFVLVNSCDVIIAISGGSGTLTEMAIAYQSKIPVICFKGVGGWSDKLAGEYLDERKHNKFLEVSSPEEAVELALKIVKKE